MAFEIDVNDKHTVKIDKTELSKYEILAQTDNSMSVRINNRNFYCTFLPTRNPKTQIIKINNTRYELKIKDDLDQLISKLGFNEIQDNHASDILSPMPGLVLDIMVKVDQEVKKGQALVILEAMKMENIIKAHGTGQIKDIKIVKGEKVEKSQLLISIEAR